MASPLQTRKKTATKRKFTIACLAEFLGMALFNIYGSVSGNTDAAAGNGISLAVLVYLTKNISGGHLNPSVTLATMISGHMGIIKGFAYICCQIAGGIVGSLILVSLVPGLYLGMGPGGTGCFAPKGAISANATANPNSNTTESGSQAKLYGWETVMTFTLVGTVYAVAFGDPGFSGIGPFAIGLALWASGYAGGQYTGAAVNPARTLGPAIVFQCYWHRAWVYVCAQVTGGLVAGIFGWWLYGPGSKYTKLFEHDVDELAAEEQKQSTIMVPSMHNPQITLM